MDDRCGRIDILVNNAAVEGPIGPFLTVDIDVWARTIETDLVGPESRLLDPTSARTRRRKPAS